MSEPTNQDLKDLILALDKRIDNLDKKFEVQFTEIKGEIKRVEEKLEAKLDGIDKRLSNEEFISRSAFTAIIVGALAGMVKYLFFSKL